MTLLMALANQNYSLVLGDRRLVSNGRVAEDEANKVCVLFCDDARVAVAYTGVAAYGTFRTQDWLRETLNKIGKNAHNLEDILAEFQARASRIYSHIRGHRIAFLICGFRYSDGPKPVCCLLSNYDPSATRSIAAPLLSRHDVNSLDGVVVAAAGFSAVLTNDDFVSLRKMLHAGNPAPWVLRKTIKIFARASADQKSLGFIGPQCNSAVIPSLPNSNIVSTYHSLRAVFRAHAADIVLAVTGCGAVVTGMNAMSPDILAGPEIRKNDPCWCGSGKRFRVCHLKKFGSVYIRIPGFKRPMAMMAAFKKKGDPVLSGSTFAVTSSFA